MQVNFSIEHANYELINIFKSIINLHSNAKLKDVKIIKEPSDELMEAIKEVENGEVEVYEDFESYKKAIDG